MRKDAWKEEHLQVIRDMAKSHTTKEIAERLTERFGILRTPATVKTYAAKNKISIGWQRGETHHESKLSDLAVQMVKTLAASGYKHMDILAEMNLNMSLPGLRSILIGDVRTDVEMSEQAKVVAQYEQEIKVLVGQYRQLQKAGGNLETTVSGVVRNVMDRIRSHLRTADYAYVYWCSILKKFKVTRKEAESDEDLVGIFTLRDDKDLIKEDLYEIVDAAYRQV